jgi:MerR family transcriptional regulator/heat shock protein HspR
MNQPAPSRRSNRAHRSTAPAEVRFYSLEVVASIVGLGPATIRRYEHLGLVEPDRTVSGFRLYTDRDIERIRQIRRLRDDLGVNLAAVEVILHMRERMLDLRREILDLRRQFGVD